MKVDPDREIRAAELLRAGLRPPEVAELTGYSINRLWEIRKKHGIPPRVEIMTPLVLDRLERGMPRGEIARELDLSGAVIVRIARESGREFPRPVRIKQPKPPKQPKQPKPRPGVDPDLIERVRELAAAGLNLTEIGEAVGRTYQTIWIWCLRHGIKYDSKKSVASRLATPGKDAAIDRLRAGENPNEIAREYGCSRSAVSTWCRFLGIKGPTRLRRKKNKER